MDESDGEEASKDSAFSASFSYEFVKSSTRESKNTVTHSTASRTLYILRQDCSYDPRALKVDDEFRYWVEKRLDAKNPDSLNAFVKEVGTHNEPIPLAISVSSITDLIIPELFPSEDAQVLSQKKSALGQVILNYLESHKPKEEGPKPVQITSGFNSSSSVFTLQAAKAPKTVSFPYIDYWSTIPYLFPTLKETSGAQPLSFYLRFDDIFEQQNLVHNTSYILASTSVRLGYFGDSYRDYDALSFYGSWPQAYFDWAGYKDRCTWTLEKLNTTGDLFIRSGDEIRLKHNTSGKYLATTSMSDGYQTLTCTTQTSDSVFIITV